MMAETAVSGVLCRISISSLLENRPGEQFLRPYSSPVDRCAAELFLIAGARQGCANRLEISSEVGIAGRRQSGR
jgi:hypothetical protein